MIAEELQKYAPFASHGCIAIVGVGGHNLGLAGTKPNTVHVHSALYDQIDRVTGMGMAAAQRIAGTTVQPDDCRHRPILLSILSTGSGACPSIQPQLGPIRLWFANIPIK